MIQRTHLPRFECESLGGNPLIVLHGARSVGLDPRLHGGAVPQVLGPKVHGHVCGGPLPPHNFQLDLSGRDVDGFVSGKEFEESIYTWIS